MMIMDLVVVVDGGCDINDIDAKGQHGWKHHISQNLNFKEWCHFTSIKIPLYQTTRLKTEDMYIT